MKNAESEVVINRVAYTATLEQVHALVINGKSLSIEGSGKDNGKTLTDVLLGISTVEIS